MHLFRLAAVTVALAIYAPSMAAPMGAPAGEPRLTKDRLPEKAFARLVEGPMKRVRAGDLAGGEAALEALLAERRRRHDGNSLETADTLHAFGVSLWRHGLDTGNEELRRKAALYVARSIPIYKAVFGPRHPEVALALTGHADALRDLDPLDPPTAVEAELEEALEIRKSTLGMAHPETATSLAGLAETKGLPSRTKGEPARIAAAAALFDEAVKIGRLTAKGRRDLPRTHLRMAEMYLANGMVEPALASFERAAAALEESGAIFTQAVDADMFADKLEDRGFHDQAAFLRARYPLPFPGAD